MRTPTASRVVCAGLLLLVSACGKSGNPGGDAALTVATPAPTDLIAAKLPANTIAYARVEGIANLEERLSATLAVSLRDAGPLRARLDAAYTDALHAAGRSNPLGLKPPTIERLVADTRSVHVALVPSPSGKADPLPVIFVHVGSADTINAVLDELKYGHKPTQVTGARGCGLDKMPPLESAIAVGDCTLALSSDAVLSAILTATEPASLAATAPFQKALADLSERGDGFAFLSIAALKEEILRDIDAGTLPAEAKAKRRATITNMPFREVSTVAASVAVDGSFSVLAYTQAGQEFPDFLVRPATARKLPARIPGDAAFTFVGGYDGGKKTRKSFVDWLQGEAQRGGIDGLGMQRSVVGALTQNLDRLESDVVIKVKGVAEDLWLAAIPVKSELAVSLAPDTAGRWGALMAFDIEDRAQAEKLAHEIFVAGKGQGLPWKETTHAGLTIHYLDLAELIKEKGENLPKDVADTMQLQIGYALSEECFYAGSVELIKFAHRPNGRTLADAMSLKGVDAKNTLLYNLQPGALLQSLSKVPALSEPLQPFVRQLPREASYTITLTIEKDRAALRSNVPVTALTAWGATQFMGMGR